MTGHISSRMYPGISTSENHRQNDVCTCIIGGILLVSSHLCTSFGREFHIDGMYTNCDVLPTVLIPQVFTYTLLLSRCPLLPFTPNFLHRWILLIIHTMLHVLPNFSWLPWKGCLEIWSIRIWQASLAHILLHVQNNIPMKMQSNSTKVPNSFIQF